MSVPDGLPPLRDVIRDLGLSARRCLGQNFLLDFNLTRRIARAAGPLDQATIVEVGPGPGGLTRALLLEGAARVIAIEKDARCLPALEAIAARYPGRLEVIGGDALEIDYGKLTLQPPARIVANLPYSVATPLLIGWLKTSPWPPWFDRLALMFQREVAQRVVAAPGGKDYGRLSVIAQWRTLPRILFGVPRGGLHAAAQGAIMPRRVHPARRPSSSLRRTKIGTRDCRRVRPAAQDAALLLAATHPKERSAAARDWYRPPSARRRARHRRLLPHRQCALIAKARPTGSARNLQAL